ncbi:hypothetical protein [Luteimonas sp. FCS-9]|uniref:PilW family protein n=1 Tax=Luteimonas sp. FCS-9 TaxID=1547516 RepID=UPI00063E9B03|nr:hypothetical protein [Luteimonas sp. FCS-9]KLI99892.1 hypothetical protein WQ56_10875 [Luteimonas sp. FCS-9]
MTVPLAPPRRCRGQTLIGMMVGVLIALLTIAAMLAIYRLVVDVSGTASREAQRDGQVGSGLLAAQIELQQAGYGLAASGTPEDTLSVRSLPDDGLAQVVWRYRPPGDTVDKCAGLRVQTSPVDAAGRSTLELLLPRVCTSAAVEHDSAWQRQLLAAYDRAWTDRSGEAIDDDTGGTTLSAPQFEISLDKGNGCTLPYAQQQVDAAFPGVARLMLVAGGRTLFASCLPNIVVAAADGTP